MSLAARYFDGHSSKGHPAALGAEPGHLLLSVAGKHRRIALRDVVISEPMGRAPRTVRFADDSYCEVADHAGFAALLSQIGHRDALSVRLHSRWRWVAAACLGVGAAILAGYLWLLPMAAEYAAPRIPAALVQQLSSGTLARLDEHFLQPSTLGLARQTALREQMAALATQTRMPAWQLHFRAPPKHAGPNAFALPSGDIVIFDNLAAAMSDAEVIAVFAHELGHVARHHGLRRMMQGAVVSTVAAIYLGDLSSLAGLLAGAMLESSYSQSFELEADAYAAQALRAAGSTPAALASALQKLEAAHLQRINAARLKTGQPPLKAEDMEQRGLWDRLFASHPSTRQRVAALQAR